MKPIHNWYSYGQLNYKLFQTTKIQNFETNSQPKRRGNIWNLNCFRPQRYKILKPIHNGVVECIVTKILFQTTKIQNFETNSQPFATIAARTLYCFRPQRYKILKPIHNKQTEKSFIRLLFQTTKIQNFETNSQQTGVVIGSKLNCFRPQRYKILKPIHNIFSPILHLTCTVSDHKDTKFWNQFTTLIQFVISSPQLFQTTKIQNFETNSQLIARTTCSAFTVSDHKDTKFWNQFTTINH